MISLYCPYVSLPVIYPGGVQTLRYECHGFVPTAATLAGRVIISPPYRVWHCYSRLWLRGAVLCIIIVLIRLYTKYCCQAQPKPQLAGLVLFPVIQISGCWSADNRPLILQISGRWFPTRESLLLSKLLSNLHQTGTLTLEGMSSTIANFNFIHFPWSKLEN